MTAFARAVEALFLDPNLTVEIWHQDQEGRFWRGRGIVRRPDEVTTFGSAQLLSETVRIDVQIATFPNPRPQEQILIGEETFLIRGEPQRDRERLVWTMTLEPA